MTYRHLFDMLDNTSYHNYIFALSLSITVQRVNIAVGKDRDLLTLQ